MLFLQYCLNGLALGCLFALIALGYTMVYGIIELVNFAHGDLVTVGAFLALTLITWLKLEGASSPVLVAGLFGVWLVVMLFCATLNWSIDRLVYKPLRKAPRLAPLVSAIGVSFILMNVGLLWGGTADRAFPDLIPGENLLSADSGLRLTWKDLMVFAITIPLMVGLTFFVRFTRLGTAMRATAQDPLAAQLMGIPSDRVIGATFLLGGALGGAASVIYALYIGVINYQMGFQNGLYAFTAAVLGGIGKIPGAVVGALLIGMIRSLGSGYLNERWNSALIFAVLIVILVFRPAGIFGDNRREKV